MSVYSHIPEFSGVYIMKDARGNILYIGKAVNLKRRVTSYFTRPHDLRIENLVKNIKNIEYKTTDSAIEALILEAALIKQYQPPFNVQEKDDKSFLYVGITKETFPRVMLIRGKEFTEEKKKNFIAGFGPFVSSGSLKEVLRIMRRIFPWNDHSPKEIELSTKRGKSCFNYHIGLCPGTCIGAVKKSDYARTTKNILLFLSGEKKKIKRNLEKEMSRASGSLEFEKAEKIKRQLFALDHMQDVAVISEDSLKIGNSKSRTSKKRIEGYDISNISGKNATGSMVVFGGESPEKAAYRKFAIKKKNSPDDTGMLEEVLERRLNHGEWPLPDLILIDGGVGQVNAAKEILKERGIRIPVIGMVKGRDRKGTDIVGNIPTWAKHNVLVRVRDEAHRFAVKYHRELRNRKFLPK